MNFYAGVIKYCKIKELFDRWPSSLSFRSVLQFHQLYAFMTSKCGYSTLLRTYIIFNATSYQSHKKDCFYVHTIYALYILYSEILIFYEYISGPSGIVWQLLHWLCIEDKILFTYRISLIYSFSISIIYLTYPRRPM